MKKFIPAILIGIIAAELLFLQKNFVRTEAEYNRYTKAFESWPRYTVVRGEQIKGIGEKVFYEGTFDDGIKLSIEQTIFRFGITVKFTDEIRLPSWKEDEFYGNASLDPPVGTLWIHVISATDRSITYALPPGAEDTPQEEKTPKCGA